MAMNFVILTMPPIWGADIEFCIRDRWLRVIFFLANTMTRMATVTNPIPPT